MGAVLLLAADLLARWLIAPQELPVACSPPCWAAAICCG
jgi:ABC-type Fe3+-siderophore transport system permease subunit